MAKHVVQRGQNLRDVASLKGVSYEGLKAANPKVDPNLLVPGEAVELPDKKTEKAVQAQSGGEKKAKGQRPPSVLRLRLRTAGGATIADASGTIEFPGKKAVPVATDGVGKLEVIVPPDLPKDVVRVAKLEIAGHRLLLRLACLPPLESPATGKLLRGGLRARLANLGYAVSSGDGPLDPALHVALATLQADGGVEIDGEPTPPTLDKLKQLHGC